MINADNFEALVDEALDTLPAFFRDRLDNVEVVIEDWPDRHTLRMMGIRSPYGLLGFYHGVPLTERTTHYGLVPPDKISIYRKPIEAHCNTPTELQDTVHRVVLHELAHYFGIDDDRLEELGAY